MVLYFLSRKDNKRLILSNYKRRNMQKYCCCTGHRPQNFPFAYGGNGELYNAHLKELEKKILTAVTEYDATRFLSGMALGVDLDFAQIVLTLRSTLPLSLECALPCRNQTAKWAQADVARYERILDQADDVTLVSERYSPECMLKRNRYMVDKSDLVIVVFNGMKSGGTWYTMNYAEKQKKAIELIDLNQIIKKEIKP